MLNLSNTFNASCLSVISSAFALLMISGKSSERNSFAKSFLYLSSEVNCFTIFPLITDCNFCKSIFILALFTLSAWLWNKSNSSYRGPHSKETLLKTSWIKARWKSSIRSFTCLYELALFLSLSNRLILSRFSWVLPIGINLFLNVMEREYPFFCPQNSLIVAI